MNSEVSQELSVGRFKFARERGGELITVPSNRPLQGYVVHDESEYVSIHILTSNDKGNRQHYLSLWEANHKGRFTAIFPEILDFGIDDEIPYYVSKIPNGERLVDYLEKSQPWPGQMAARVLCRFLTSLRFQEEISFNDLAISFESLWIEKTIYGPRILIGDVVLDHKPNANADNAALILSVFKELTKEEEPDRAISTMFANIAKGPLSLSFVEKNLKSFALAGDFRQIEWTSDNEPEPLLDRVVSGINQISKKQLIETKQTVRLKKDCLANLIGYGRFRTSHANYRSAIELDPFAKTPLNVSRLASIFASIALVAGLVALLLFSEKGRSLFGEISNHLGKISYEPTLIYPAKSKAAEVEFLTIKPAILISQSGDLE